MKLLDLVPMLNVADIERSLEFYNRVLGFELVSEPAAVRESRWAAIRSGNTELMLSESRHQSPPKQVSNEHKDTGWPAILYFYPDAVVALYAHVVASGFEPTPLEVTRYGMREFSLIDPDGHVLCCGQRAAAQN